MKMKLCLISISFTLFYLLLSVQDAIAQCAMCRATLESQASNGESLTSGINGGILYLAAIPYLVLGGIAYFWYKNSIASRAKKEQITGYFRG